MATAPAAREPLHTLTYKTWVLKVSIHCESCKKKVKKVLHNVEGVYETNIDTKQQKVTVTGNISAETLINKLVKSGKNAELWPELIMEKEKKTGKPKKKKQIEQPMKTADQQEGHKEIGKEKSAIEVEDIPQEIAKKIQVNSAQAPNESENIKSVVKNGEVVETKAEGKKPETSSADKQTPGGEKMSSEHEPSVGGCHSKTKKNKGRKSHVEAASSTTSTPELIEISLPVVTNDSPPFHHGYQYLPHDYAPPPVYAVSYNTALPSSSTTALYYGSPPPISYAYMHAGPETRSPPSDIDLYTRQPLDSFEMFSDENPNGCYIM